MLFVGTSIIHPSTEGVFLLCNILDLLIYSRQQKEDGSDVSLNMFVSLLRKGFYLLCALMLFGFSSTNLKLSLSCTYNFSSKWLHHLKNDSIRVSEIKSSAFPKSICPKIEILRFRQALHMIFDKGFVNKINVIRVKAYF